MSITILSDEPRSYFYAISIGQPDAAAYVGEGDTAIAALRGATRSAEMSAGRWDIARERLVVAIACDRRPSELDDFGEVDAVDAVAGSLRTSVIRALCDEAEAAGDGRIVAECTKALRGDALARRIVADALIDAAVRGHE